jgi:hypothetical protein
MTLRLSLVALLCASVVPAFGQKIDPRREPATAVAEAIRVLERKDYATFLQTFARPEELKELLASKKIEEVAAEFGKEKAADILIALKAAAKMTPTLSREGTRADYRFEKPIGGESRITLEKIGEYWYFR